MAVYKRVDGKGWRVDFKHTYPNGERERVRRTKPTKREALHLQRELPAQLDAAWHEAQRPDTEDCTFSEFLPRLWSALVGEGVKASSIRSYRSIVRLYLNPVFGASKLGAIRPLAIEDFKTAQHKRGLAPKTIANQIAVLSKVLRLAAELEVIDRMPVIRFPSKHQRTNDAQGFDFWDFDEMRRVLEVVDTEPRIAHWLRLALASGLRAGELTGLQWGDLDLSQRILNVRRQVYKGDISIPKSNRLRSVPLSDAAIEALQLQKPRTFLRAVGEDDWVFVDDDGLFNYNRIRDGYHRIIRRAGVKRIRIHDMRHTFASHAVMRGVPIEVVQQWLGHSDIRVTMRYAHLAPAHSHRFIEKMNAPCPPRAPQRETK